MSTSGSQFPDGGIKTVTFRDGSCRNFSAEPPSVYSPSVEVEEVGDAKLSMAASKALICMRHSGVLRRFFISIPHQCSTA